MTGIATIGSTATPTLSGTTGTGTTDYLKELASKFSNLQIRTGTVTPDMMKNGELKPEDIPPHGPGDGNVFIDSRYIKKMQSNPEEAKKTEEFLKSIPDQEKQLRESLEENQRKLLSRIPGSTGSVQLVDHGFTIDKDGNVGCWGVAFGSISTPGASERGGGLLGGTSGSGKDDNKASLKDKGKSAVERMQEELRRILEKKNEEQAEAGGPVDYTV